MVPRGGRRKPCPDRSASCNIRPVKDTENPARPGPPDSDREAVFVPDVTVAALVRDGDRLLLVEEDVRGSHVINQPAGHLEAGESLAEAMVRECLEETGWRVEPSGLVGIYQWVEPASGRQFMRVAFAARPIAHDAGRPLDEGILRPLWLTAGELRDCASRHRSPLVLQVVEDFLARPALPLDAARWLG